MYCIHSKEKLKPVSGSLVLRQEERPDSSSFACSFSKFPIPDRRQQTSYSDGCQLSSCLSSPPTLKGVGESEDEQRYQLRTVNALYHQGVTRVGGGQEGSQLSAVALFQVREPAGTCRSG